MKLVETVKIDNISPYLYSMHKVVDGGLWSYPRHRHEQVMEFYYVFQGKVDHFFDNEKLTMGAGDLLLVEEDEFHSLRGQSFGFYNLIFSTEKWDELLEAWDLRSLFYSFFESKHFFIQLDYHKRGALIDLLDKMFLYQKSLYGDLLFKEFIISLISHLSAKPQNKLEIRPDWFELLLIKANLKLDQGIKVKDLVKMSHKSQEHLARTFKKYLGLSPSSWLNQEKLRLAALLLTHSNTPIIDIALSLGFSNLNYFYKIFRKIYLMPPGEYRQKKNPLYSSLS